MSDEEIVRARQARLQQAKDRIAAALASSEPRVELRAVAIDLASNGFDRTALVDAFRLVHEEQIDAGFDTDAAFLSDALDMIETWYDRGKASF